MTGKLLPFDRPTPPEPEPEPTMVTREERPGGLSFTLTIGHEAIERAMLEGAPLAEWSPPDDVELADADGFLYADDDGPD